MKTLNILQDNYKVQKEFQIPTLEILNVKLTKGCKNIYSHFVSNDAQPTCCKRWTDRLTLSRSYNWNKVFQRPFKMSKDTSLIWLQTRIIHRLLATNSLLFKMKLIESDKCSFCKVESETLEHLFWECNNIRKFWHNLVELMKSNGILDSNIELSIETILFGYADTNNIIDLIIMVAKRYIYYAKIIKNPLV